MKRNLLRTRGAQKNIEYSKSLVSSRFAASHAPLRRGGFTIIELLVVIAIAAILSAILLAGFANLSSSNKRVACQTNLQQIYSALRMYAADNDGGYPYYNASAANGGTTSASTPEDTRFGLWALYTNDRVTNSNGDLDFPSNRVPDADNSYANLSDNPLRPVGIYLRGAGNLHCPADRGSSLIDDDGDSGTPDVLVSHEELFSNGNRTRFNPNYLSYQTLDNGAEVFTAAGPNVATYQSQRVTDVNALDSNGNRLWPRQLTFFDGPQRVFDQRAASNTVITWCKWHRTGLGGRNSDPILFADGTVRSLPLVLPSTPTEMGWTR